MTQTQEVQSNATLNLLNSMEVLSHNNVCELKVHIIQKTGSIVDMELKGATNDILETALSLFESAINK